MTSPVIQFLINSYYTPKHQRALDMRWLIANETRRVEFAIANLISNKREWNNCLLNSVFFYTWKL